MYLIVALRVYKCIYDLENNIHRDIFADVIVTTAKISK